MGFVLPMKRGGKWVRMRTASLKMIGTYCFHQVFAHMVDRGRLTDRFTFRSLWHCSYFSGKSRTSEAFNKKIFNSSGGNIELKSGWKIAFRGLQKDIKSKRPCSIFFFTYASQGSAPFTSLDPGPVIGTVLKNSYLLSPGKVMFIQVFFCSQGSPSKKKGQVGYPHQTSYLWNHPEHQTWGPPGHQTWGNPLDIKPTDPPPRGYQTWTHPSRWHLVVITGDLFKLVHLGVSTPMNGGHWNWSMYGFQTGGTHPTGLLSCWIYYWLLVSKTSCTQPLFMTVGNRSVRTA